VRAATDHHVSSISGPTITPARLASGPRGFDVQQDRQQVARGDFVDHAVMQLAQRPVATGMIGTRDQ